MVETLISQDQAVALTLTAEQIRCIYEAGIRQGVDEAMATSGAISRAGSLGHLKEALLFGVDAVVQTSDREAWWSTFKSGLQAKPARPAR